MKKYLLPIILGLFTVVTIQGQTIEEVLDSAFKNYSSSEWLQFSTTYKLYKTATATEVAEQYSGMSYKKGSDSFFTTINDTDILRTAQVSLKVNHSEKAMLVTDTENTLSTELDLTQLLLVYEKESIKTHDAYWEITLKSKKLTTEPYYKIVLHISKQYELKKQVFYYANSLDFSKDYRISDLSQPRLEIIYSDYTTKAIAANTFDSARYITTTASSNKIIVSNTYTGYELLDRRTFSNKIHTAK